MFKLFLFWLLGKTLKISLHDCLGNYIINQITLEDKYNQYSEIVIYLKEKSYCKLNKKRVL
jgi:hypothetical protein